MVEAKKHSDRDWLMILVAFWHGLRASELVGIKANDIESDYLTVKRLNGSLKTRKRLVTHADPVLNARTCQIEFMARTHRNQRVFDVARIQL